MASAIALSACGLLAPPGPPAAEIGGTPQAPPADVPIPTSPSPPSTPAGPSTPAEIPPTPPFPGYTLTWHDEFNGNALDATKWGIDEGPRHNAINSKDSVSVRDGLLRLTTFTDAAGVHHTGMVQTRGKMEATYGYFEARLRPNEASANWCAFWIYADTIGTLIGDPADAGVEIDVIEHRLENRDRYDLSNYTFMNLNWDGFGTDWKSDGRLTMLPDNGPIQGTWRTYAVLWTDTGYVFYVDGAPIWKTSAAVSHRSEYIYLSCEVANNSWAGWIPPGGYGTLATSTTGLQVDWVRVWQKQ